MVRSGGNGAELPLIVSESSPEPRSIVNTAMPENWIPLAPMPNPVKLSGSRVPVLDAVLPVSSTCSVSWPLPTSVSAPWIASSTPPLDGAKLPT